MPLPSFRHWFPKRKPSPRVIVVDRATTAAPVTGPELFDTFRNGRDDQALWYRAARQTLFDLRAGWVSQLANVSDPDSRAQLAGGIEMVEEILDQWEEYATTPADQLAAKVREMFGDE